MSSHFNEDDLQVDSGGQDSVLHLEHLDRPFTGATVGEDTLSAELSGGTLFAAPPTPQALAEQYLREVAPIYGISDNMLPGHGATDFAGTEAPDTSAGSLDLIEEKEVMGTTTIAYQQTYNGLPVWEAGVSVTILPQPMRVTASQSSVHRDITLPGQEGLIGGTYVPEAIKETVLKRLLGVKQAELKINGMRQLIFRYDSDKRIDPSSQAPSDAPLQGGPPTLPLPPAPGTIHDGEHYVVTEVLFTLPVDGYGPVNWRAFVEVNSGTVLYLRSFIACVHGMIFRTDPLTAGGAVTVVPTASQAVLNPFRITTTISGLTNGNPQALRGEYVELVDTQPPAISPPTQANPPGNFFYNAPTREFAAVNAYHHCDWLFRLMGDMGFNVRTYFDGTTFPIPVDGCAFSDAVNARAPGNPTGMGSGGFQFGLAGAPFPSVGIAADVRVVLHEFGHALMWDAVHSPNFGFAHSAGDSLAAILLDPESALRIDPVRRFATFPWLLPNRRHDRDVAAGWGWDGANYGPFAGIDPAGYLAEQILSTTLFRAYRSTGGDSDDVNRRKLAARQMVYLIFRAIGSLASNPVTTTPRPEVFVTALMSADIGTLNFEGYRGGVFHKVIRWSFEKQGLYQASGTPRPVTTPGNPPRVDVYINDGRNGEYTFQPVYWECTDIWNRRNAGAGGGGGVHQPPVVGRTNFAYARVKNRGTQIANNVVVRGYSANPGAGLTWPADWTPMDTPQIAVPGGIPASGSVVVGPFRWTPRFVGHECMFMEVSSDTDRSNIDATTFYPSAAGPTPDWLLVPFDNNVAQRNVAPVPGAGGIRGLLSAFVRRSLLVRNPFDKPVRIETKAVLPSFLIERGWGVKLDYRDGGNIFTLANGERREITITLKPGKDFNRDDVLRAKEDTAVRVVVHADGIMIGGMTYVLDPKLRRAPIERVGDKPIRLDDPEIEAAINASEH